MTDEMTTPGPVFQTKEEAQNWVMEQCVRVREARARCDLEPAAAVQKQWHHKLLLRYGAAKGALDALYRCGQLTAPFYQTCCQQILLAIATKVTDVSGKEGRHD